MIYQLYDLMKWGPTASNTCPARFVWVRSPEGKSLLASVAMPPNRPKILAAPLTVIIGNDLGFSETLPKLVAPERVPMVLGMLKAHEGMTESMAMRNGSLQGAYLILAARALGLDCWPMSGFDNAGVDREFLDSRSLRQDDSRRSLRDRQLRACKVSLSSISPFKGLGNRPKHVFNPGLIAERTSICHSSTNAYAVLQKESVCQD
jgi:hypothetical protein